MKLHTLIFAAAGLTASVAPAAATTPAVAMQTDGSSCVRALQVERSDNNLFVSMELDFSELKLKSDREITYMPVLTLGDSICELPQVVVAGRNRYIQHQRHNDLADDVRLCRAGKVIDYAEVIPYEQWMETALLSLTEDECGCGFNAISSTSQELAVLDFKERVFAPVFAFITPEVELVKSREVRGSAYIDFPVNRTEIRPDYRRNPEELQKIRNTIDVIRDDADTRIVSVAIEGYASPEGPLKNNERLAQGRTEALVKYVRSLYSFEPSLIKSGWVAEDWAGLRRYVESSDMSEKAGILDIIDLESMAPDAREWRLKSAYPEEYRFLLDNVYPGLRHSDYAVEYVIRSYADVAEIRELIKTTPQKLSLHEMFVLAQSLEPGSDEYREVFEVAVRMYPDDPVANLNAANIALGRDELDRAEVYLAKAGDAPEAVYARGILAAKRGDYATAYSLFDRAAAAGCRETADAVEQLREMERYAQSKDGIKRK